MLAFVLEIKFHFIYYMNSNKSMYYIHYAKVLIIRLATAVLCALF